MPYVISHVTDENLFGYQVESVVLAVAIPLNDGHGLLVQYKTSDKNFDNLLSQGYTSIKPAQATSKIIN